MLASVGVLRLAPLALLLSGCFADPGRHGPGQDSSPGTGEAAAATSTTASPTTGDAPTTTLLEHATTTSDATSELAGSTTTTDPTDTTTTTTSSEPGTTGPPPTQCGNGELEPGEACDDGALNGGEGCNLDCSAPSCGDLHVNQGESDIDCGGPCLPCPACLACNSDADCGAPFTCAAGVCAGAKVIAIDYLANCAQTFRDWPPGPVFPAGVYRIIAEGGGGTNNKDLPAYGWLVQCANLDITEMNVPFTYPTPQDAFQALPTKQVLRSYPGGPLRCGLQDILCADNLGGVSLSFAPACP